MDRINSRIAQVYGYAVCLICVGVFLVALHGILGAAFDLTDPVRVEQHSYSFGPPFPLTSFPAYRLASRQMERMQQMSRMPRSPDGTMNEVARPAPLSDDELRQNYETERAERIGAVRFHAMRVLVIGLVFITLAAGVFLLHWRWLRRSNIESMTS